MAEIGSEIGFAANSGAGSKSAESLDEPLFEIKLAADKSPFIEKFVGIAGGDVDRFADAQEGVDMPKPLDFVIKICRLIVYEDASRELAVLSKNETILGNGQAMIGAIQIATDCI